MRGIVYRIFAEDGALLYVGATGTYLIRLANHERDREWWDEAHHVTLEHFSSRDAALAAEPEIIEREQPKYNIAHTKRPLNEAEVQARRAAKEQREREWREQWAAEYGTGGSVRCGNCGATPLRLPKGQRVAEIACPRCGVTDLMPVERTAA